MHRAQGLLLLTVFATGPLAAQAAGPQTGGPQTSGGLQKRTPESFEAMRRAERTVTLDVQVTDASGKPVAGLQERDLTLLDNGRPQTITSFGEIDGSRAVPPAEVVLLLDTMNASFQDVVIERQGIEAFLRQNGGRLALPVTIVFLADTGAKLGKTSQDGNSLADDLKKLQTPMRVLDPAQGGEGAQDRTQRSLRALQMLSTYEGARPGRKLLVWVGPGWPLLSRSTADVSAREHSRYFNSIIDMTTSLRRAHITLDSVAPLNLAQYSENPLLYEAYMKGVEGPEQADSPDLSLPVLAVHSGGMVLNKSGDLAGEIARCVADGQRYYEITFEAAEDDAAGRYHSLQVKAGRAGAMTRSSTSYYAGGPQSTGWGVAAAPSVAITTTGAAAGTKTIRAEARLVIVDVTALDKRGQPLAGLTDSQFQLKEDNEAQKIVSVEEHRQQVEAIAPAATTAATSTTDGVIVASNKPAAGTVWNVVLVDLSNTQKEDRSRLQSQLEQFLKQLPEHQPLALVTMSGHIKIESSFQEGAGAAYQYLHKHGLGPLDASTPSNIVERGEVEMPSADIGGTAISHQADLDVERQSNRAQTALDCFSELARWLTPYSGKKNVYWLSGGFPLQGQPFGTAAYNVNTPGLGADTKGRYAIPMQQKLDKELEVARVSIYPVDTRGVAPPDIDGVTTADTTYSGNISIVAAKDNSLKAARQQEMLEIAKATGGTAQFNNNISKALRDDFEQGNAYYTIAYTPPEVDSEGAAYHRIVLSVDQPGAKLIYREGYYARSAEAGTKPTPEQFKDALRLGAPGEMAVQFTSKITKAGDAATVEYGVEPQNVELGQDAAGQFLVDIDFAVFEYDAKGKVLEKGLVRLSGQLTPEQRAHVTAKTLGAKQTIALKAGATTLVLGVRDRVSGRFGSVEVELAGR